MSDSPSNVGRRTRRARRVSLEQFDVMQRDANSARARADGVLVPDPEPGADLPEGQDPGVPSHGTLRTDARTSDDLAPPGEAAFSLANGTARDFLPAPGVRRVANALIARDRHIRHLADLRIEYLFRRRGGTAKQMPRYGETVLPAGLSRHAWNQMAIARTGSANERVHAVIWLAADHLAELSALQTEAILYGLLLRIVPSQRRNAEGALALRQPNLAQFDLRQIERYGLFMQDLLHARETFKHAQPVPASGQTALPLDGEPLDGEPEQGNDPWETTSVEIPETTANGAAGA